jgi:transcriptional regulator with XRE-family HTH domain
MSDPVPGRPATEPLLRTLLGAVIRRARHDQRRTLSEVAADAGVSVPYLSEIERGRKEPSSELLAAVCRALGLDLLDLVSRTYIDLVGRQLEVAEARPLQVVRPLRTGAVTGGPAARSLGRSGDVVALAA